MKMPDTYTYRFYFKFGFFMMCFVCILLVMAWISTAVERDNNKAKEMYYRDKYITYKALYLVSVIQTDLIIDQITAQEMDMWDLYCSRKELFRENIARKAMETETKQGK